MGHQFDSATAAFKARAAVARLQKQKQILTANACANGQELKNAATLITA